MATETLRPTADSGGAEWSNPSLARDTDVNTFAEGLVDSIANPGQLGPLLTSTRTYTTWGSPSGTYGQLDLYVKSDVTLFETGDGISTFQGRLRYSINGGSSWTNVYDVSTDRGLTTDSISLSPTQDLSQLQVEVFIKARADDRGSSAGHESSTTLDFYDIRTEGILRVDVTVNLSGSGTASSVGTVTATGGTIINASGNSTASYSGSLSITGTANVTLSGSSVTSGVGSVTVVIGTNVNVSGFGLTSSSGTLSITGGATVTPTGAVSTSSSGNLLIPNVEVVLTGRTITSFTNSVSIGAGITVNPTGNSLTSSVGTVTLPNIYVNVSGNSITSSAGLAVVSGTGDVTARVYGSTVTETLRPTADSDGAAWIDTTRAYDLNLGTFAEGFVLSIANPGQLGPTESSTITFSAWNNNPTYTYTSLDLKIKTEVTIDDSVGDGVGTHQVILKYSTNGGSSYTNIYNVSTTRALTTDTISLSAGQDLSQIIVQCYIEARADDRTGSAGQESSTTVDIYDIRTEGLISPPSTGLTSDKGTLTATGSADVSLSGSSTIASSGTPAVTGSASFTLTGSEAVINIGDPSIFGDNAVLLVGQSLTAQTNTPTITGDAVVQLSGSFITSIVGTLLYVGPPIDAEVDLSGILISGNLGMLSITGTAFVQATNAALLSELNSLIVNVSGSPTIRSSVAPMVGL